MCLSDLGHKATCFVEPVFSVFLDNLMLEFFQKKALLSEELGSRIYKSEIRYTIDIVIYTIDIENI